MKIGFFLGFQPGVNLTTEGISRLLAFILKENSKQNTKMILFCPEWLREPLKELLEDNMIKIDGFEICTTNSIPFGVKLKTKFIEKRKEKKNKPNRIYQVLKKIKSSTVNLLKHFIVDLFSTSSLLFLCFKLISYSLIFLILSPLLIFMALFVGLFTFVRKLMHIFKLNIFNVIKNKFLTVANKTKGIIYQIVIDNELNKLVRLINYRNDIDACFIPSMGWPQIKDLKCKKILAAPDIVFYDFPTQFIGVGEIHKRIRQSINAADKLICYSEFVKQEHLVDKCGIEPKKITVIKHANVDMSSYLKDSSILEKHYSLQQNAKYIVSKYIQNKHQKHFFNSDLSSFEFIIYSSQYRPHKNIFNLIKAIKICNYEFHRNIKLILTGNIIDVNYMKKYIESYHLYNDIFVMHGLPSEVLAAFNNMAKCAVNPTLFEGGFPFTFSEAYSVGTPSIMSDIPVVRHEIDNTELKDSMLFDPYNPYSIAKKIVWAIDNYETLYQSQKQLYEKFSHRDWRKVAQEYNHVFHEIH
ncbi:glycosyltransferase [Paenibacillus puldeungensis]|uniref:Glycosyltransferase n=1 Tax=Paenibacillus puldeungensis TaxID=696536 RepID=A0ABW3S4H9_9BACL